MTAEIVQISKAIVDVINGRNWNVDCSAVFDFAPYFELTDLNVLHVTVSPLSSAITINTRTGYINEYDIGVAVQQRVTDNQRIEELLALGWSFAETFLNLRKLTGYEAALITGARFEPLYLEEHLRDFRLFTGAVVLSFRVYS